MYINKVNEHGDGMTLCNRNHYVVENTMIDLSSQPLDKIDECLGVTWGASATVRNCVFRGAGKLVLCGSGDSDKREVEKNSAVRFEKCIFEVFGRRGIEIQSGMAGIMENCVIRDWGSPYRFDTRSFGAWCHGKGTRLTIKNCVFSQGNRFTQYWFKDLVNHIGQAWNDEGIKGIFSKNTWIPGNWRGATASDGGRIECINCFTIEPFIYLENRKGDMPMDEAVELMVELDMVKDRLMEGR